MNKPSDQLSSKQILVIDDMVESRGSLKRMLLQLGAEKIDTAVEGDEAIAKIQQREYDLIVSDYNLGRGKDGQQILEEARYSGSFKATSIFVMVTGENAADMVMGALEYEPDAYLTKPITPQMLAQRLKRIMQGKYHLWDMLQMIDARKYQRAVEIANQLMERHPNQIAPIARQIGPVYMHLGEYNNAIRVYSSVLNEHYRSWARLGQAICMHKLGDSLGALSLLKDTLKRQPRYVQCYDWMARIYLTLGDKEYAQQLLRKAASISPKAVLRQRELAELAQQNGNWLIAANAYEQAIRLGRHSCYKSVDVYLKLADCVQPLLEQDLATNRRLGQKAQRALAELQTDFNNQFAIQYAGYLAEARINYIMGLPDKARHSLAMAEAMFHEMEAPQADDALSLTSTLIKCGEHVKANEVLRNMEGMELTPAQRASLEKQMQRLDEASIKQNSDRVNAEGISFYEDGDFRAAMKAFDEAVNYPDAGISVLLNSIQVRVSLIKQGDCTAEESQQLIRECRPLFQRIGSVEESDGRFERYQRLKINFTRLLQELAT
ncbi:response regulator [Oceanobacter mangrovi]|uniref:response regulator n=1 Tax=Oceanobacter mangrovi TaxID=2862510 RepID=UPI001C8EE8F3|nr:response regulator [Oceanobacter mangrovi]